MRDLVEGIRNVAGDRVQEGERVELLRDVLEEGGEGVQLLREIPYLVPDVFRDVAGHLGELADAGEHREQPEPIELGRHPVKDLYQRFLKLRR